MKGGLNYERVILIANRKARSFVCMCCINLKTKIMKSTNHKTMNIEKKILQILNRVKFCAILICTEKGDDDILSFFAQKQNPKTTTRIDYNMQSVLENLPLVDKHI